jgi:pullulanase
MFVALTAVALLTACGGDDEDPVDPGNGTVQRTFTYVKPANAPAVTSVSLAGSFNEWSTTTHAMTQQANGSWRTTIPLARGTYQYKFVMNGNQWPSNMCNDPTWGDPNNGGKVDATVTSCSDDGHGGQNAVLTIQ